MLNSDPTGSNLLQARLRAFCDLVVRLCGRVEEFVDADVQLKVGTVDGDG
jgi:hypothetical protein